MGRTLMVGEYTQQPPAPRRATGGRRCGVIGGLDAGGLGRWSSPLPPPSNEVVGAPSVVESVASSKVASAPDASAPLSAPVASPPAASPASVARSSAASDCARSASFWPASVVTSAARWASGPALTAATAVSSAALAATWRATGAAWVVMSLIIVWSCESHSLPFALAEPSPDVPSAPARRTGLRWAVRTRWGSGRSCGASYAGSVQESV